MRMSVFSRTIGLRGEDTSTEVLRHLLSAEALNVPFQRLFFLKTCGTPKSSADLDAELVTRPVCPGGTPDALILTEDSIILLENKLGSPLSGEDQLIRYIRILETNAGMVAAFPTFEPARIKRRLLVFLAPRATIAPSLQATTLYTSRTADAPLEVVCRDKGVELVQIAWEDLIGDLDEGNALQQELRLYVQDYLEQELTMHERDVLTDASVPTALEKLFKKILTVRDSLAADGFTPGRMGQSYNSFGFTAEHADVSLWFGYSLLAWSSHGTPVVLQLRKKWIKTGEEFVMVTAQECHFTKDDRLEWVLPFQVSDMGKWDLLLRDVLARFAVARSAKSQSE